MTDRRRLTWQQAFVKRVMSLSTARWIFSLLSEQWWRERSADGVVIDLQVMQDSQWSLRSGNHRRRWTLNLREDCSRPKCLTPHSRKYAWDFSSNQPTWKMKMKIRRMKRKMRETVKSAEWRVEEYQDNNNMRMTHGWCAQDTLNQCQVRHWNVCCETLENATCEGVLFTWIASSKGVRRQRPRAQWRATGGPRLPDETPPWRWRAAERRRPWQRQVGTKSRCLHHGCAALCWEKCEWRGSVGLTTQKEGGMCRELEDMLHADQQCQWVVGSHPCCHCLHKFCPRSVLVRKVEVMIHKFGDTPWCFDSTPLHREMTWSSPFEVEWLSTQLARMPDAAAYTTCWWHHDNGQFAHSRPRLGQRPRLLPGEDRLAQFQINTAASTRPVLTHLWSPKQISSGMPLYGGSRAFQWPLPAERTFQRRLAWCQQRYVDWRQLQQHGIHQARNILETVMGRCPVNNSTQGLTSTIRW